MVLCNRVVDTGIIFVTVRRVKVSGRNGDKKIIRASRVYYNIMPENVIIITDGRVPRFVGGKIYGDRSKIPYTKMVNTM